MNTIFDQLKEEHTQLKDLLKKAVESDPSDRKGLLAKIEKLLVPHARAEEKTLYALLREKAESENEENALDLTNEAYEEHRVADELIADLKGCDIRDEKWSAKMKVIKENIEHHISEEEDELFEQAKRLFNEGQLAKLLMAYKTVKQSFAESLPTQGQIRERTASAEARNTLH